MKNKEIKKDNSIKRLCIIAAVCFAVALTSGALMLYHYFAPRKTAARVVIVPDLVGVCEDSMSVPRGVVIEREYVYSDSVESGTVISQSPAPKSRRKQAEDEPLQVKITVSLGKKTGAIPDVAGMPYVEAAIRLREIGADVVAVSVYDTEGKAGTVLSTSPSADTEIREGDRVVIYVARARVNASVKVPLIVGMESDRAATELWALGLRLGKIEYIMSDDALVGRVIKQSIAPDVYVRGGTEIDIAIGCEPDAYDDHI